MIVSAIIPVRNMEKFLARAIDSVKDQTVKVDEIIVAVDSSTDRSEEVARYSGVDAIITNTSGEPWGICGGRNNAFKVAQGMYILPLDADDWIEPTYVEKTLAKMGPKVGIVSTAMVYHGEREGDIIPAKKQTYQTELGQNNITVTSLVRRDAIVEAGEWDHNLRGWEDWDMWIRILKLNWEHEVVNEPLFHYRLHNTGMNAWANQTENKQRLYGYLLQKHPDFGILKMGL